MTGYFNEQPKILNLKMDGSSTPPDRKRKRAASDAVINPLSHSPDTLRQFALAGYPPEQPLPFKAYPGFPHRPAHHHQHRNRRALSLTEHNDDDDQENDVTHTSDENADADIDTATDAASTSAWQTTTTDGETTDAESPPSQGAKGKQTKKHSRASRTAHAYRARVGVLAAAVQRCLAEGDIATAKRAFGLLARAKVNGRRVDLRYGRAWEWGAECLMREGEKGAAARGGDGEEVEEDEEVRLAREEDRLERLKAYYRYLIQQYPFIKSHVATSAEGVLEFQAALFGAEMEAAYTRHKRRLERLRRGDGDDGGMDFDDDEPMDYDYDLDGADEVEGRTGGASHGANHLHGLSRRELRAREREDEVRLEALERMTDIALRMDTVMETAPFSRDHELLRLRAMIALYIGDLCVPPAPRSVVEDAESRRARDEQRTKARGFLQRIKDGGGVLKDHDENLLESLESGDEDEEADDDEAQALPMFSSMNRD